MKKNFCKLFFIIAVCVAMCIYINFNMSSFEIDTNLYKIKANKYTQGNLIAFNKNEVFLYNENNEYINFSFKEEIIDVSLISYELQKFLLCCTDGIYIYDNINTYYEKITELTTAPEYCDLYFDSDTQTKKIFCILQNNELLTLNTDGNEIKNYMLPQEINVNNIQEVIMTNKLTIIFCDNKLYYIYPNNSYNIIDNVTDITTDRIFYYIKDKSIYEMTNNIEELSNVNAKKIENYCNGYIYIDNNNELFLKVYSHVLDQKISKNFNIIKTINNLYNVDNVYTTDAVIFVQKKNKIIILKN